MKLSNEKNRQLTNAIKRYNRKIEKINQYLEPKYRLEKETLTSIKKSINIRQDYKTIMSFLESPFKPNATNISKTYNAPNVVVNQTKRLLTIGNRENRVRQAQVIKVLEESGQIVNDQQMNHPEVAQYRERKLKPKNEGFDLARFAKSIRQQTSKDYDEKLHKIYKDNYINALHNPLRISPYGGRQVEAMIGGISNSTFYFLSIGEYYQTFEYLYKPLDYDQSLKEANIISSWNSTINSL